MLVLSTRCTWPPQREHVPGREVVMLTCCRELSFINFESAAFLAEQLVAQAPLLHLQETSGPSSPLSTTGALVGFEVCFARRALELW
jgi:hypothetical protein